MQLVVGLPSACSCSEKSLDGETFTFEKEQTLIVSVMPRPEIFAEEDHSHSFAVSVAPNSVVAHCTHEVSTHSTAKC